MTWGYASPERGGGPRSGGEVPYLGITSQSSALRWTADARSRCGSVRRGSDQCTRTSLRGVAQTSQRGALARGMGPSRTECWAPI